MAITVLRLLIRDVINGTSLVAQMVKNPPAMQRPRFYPWVQEDLLEKQVGMHSSIRAWRIPQLEESGELYSPWGHKESDIT